MRSPGMSVTEDAKSEPKAAPVTPAIKKKTANSPKKSTKLAVDNESPPTGKKISITREATNVTTSESIRALKAAPISARMNVQTNDTPTTTHPTGTTDG